ncbi:MAG: hypothetical protein Q9221_007566 [Calogaya cf. arnoldii]
MFTCRALRHKFGSELLHFPVFTSEDKDSLLNHSPIPLTYIPLSGIDYDLIACVKLRIISIRTGHWKSGWENGLLAIALQRRYQFVLKRVIEAPRLGYKTTYNSVPPRAIYVEDVKTAWRAIKHDPDLSSMYSYWKQYDKTTGKSTGEHPYGLPPSLEQVEAVFKAALWKWDDPEAEEWKILDNHETVVPP